MEFGWLGIGSQRNTLAPGGVVLDIETTGLRTGLPVVEAAVYNRDKGVATRWAIEPHFAGERITADQVLDHSEQWFKERHKSMFSWVGRDAAQVAPNEFVRQLAPHLQGQTVWIQNAPFESRMLGSFLKHNVAESEAYKLKSMMETSPASPKSRFNLFYTTGLEMSSVKAVARETGDWLPVFEQMVREMNTPITGTRVRDIQDVTRAVFSESQRIGIMKNLNSFTGSNMNVMSLAYGFGAEEHRAAADTILESKVLDRMWRTATGMSNARKAGLLGEAAFLFDQSYREDLTALKRIDSIREMQKTKAIFRSLAEARLAIEFDKNAEYAITEKFDSWMAPMDTYGGKVVEQRISFPRKKVPADFDEAVRLLSSDHIHGKGMSTVVDSAVTKIKVASESQLRDMVHAPFALENEANSKLLSMMDKAGRFTNWDAARILFAKHPIKAAGFALTGLTLAAGTLEAATARTAPDAIKGDSYVDWSGLEAYGVGSDMRRHNADFGSGWKGVLDTILKTDLSRPMKRSSGWLTSADAALGDISADGRAWRAMKKVEAGDFSQATRFMRQNNMSMPREVAVSSRMSNIDMPRLQSPTMASLMAGADPAQAGSSRARFVGARDFNVIKGLGHGAKRANAQFGSSWKGLQKVALGIYEPSPEVWGAVSQSATARGIQTSVAGIKKTLEMKGPQVYESVHAGQIEELLSTAEDLGLGGRIGLVKPGLSRVQRERTARHEAAHLFMPNFAREGLHEASLKAIRAAGLEDQYAKSKALRYKPGRLFEELSARQAELGAVPGATFEEMFTRRLNPETLAIYDMFNPIITAGSQVSSHMRDMYRFRLTPEGNAFSGWHRAYNDVMGMSDEGLGAMTRRLKDDFGSPWQGLRKLMTKLGATFAGFKKPPLTAEFQESAFKELYAAGVVETREQATHMMQSGKWVRMGDLKYLKLQTLGKGGFGQADLMVAESGAELSVLKTLLPEGVGSSAAARQALPHRYSRSATEESASEAQKHFTEMWQATKLPAPSTARANVEKEFGLQHAAELQELSGDIATSLVPALHGKGVVSELGFMGGLRSLFGKEQYGFAQEYGGITLESAMKKGIIPEARLPQIEAQIRQYVDDIANQGGVFNWDISKRNIVVNPRTFEPKIIDYGAATFMQPAIQREHRAYASQFADEVVERIFGRHRGPKKVAKEVQLAQDAAVSKKTFNLDTGKMPTSTSKVSNATSTLSKKTATARIEANRRAHQMAEIQASTSKQMFKSPTGHTKGGS